MQGFGHINLKGEIIPVLVRQGKRTWSYKQRRPSKEKGFEVMDNTFFNTPEGLKYIELIKSGKTVTL